MACAAACALLLYGVSAWISPRDRVHTIALHVPCPAKPPACAEDIAAPAESFAERSDALDAATVGAAPCEHRKAIRDRIAELAAELGCDVFDRAAFETRTGAVAAGLGAAEIREVAEVADDRGAGARTIVCAAEVLRLCAEKLPTAVAPLAPATREALRDAFEHCADDPPLAFASVRALAALGNDEDRRVLVDALSRSTDARKRDLAGVGLRAAASAETVGALRQLVMRPNDTRCCELGLVALEDIWRAAHADSLSADEREACARCLSECLARRDAPLVLRQRAATALAAVGGAHVREALLGTFMDSGGDRDLARSAAAGLATLADPAAAQSLATLLRDPLLDEERRVLAAEAIARSAAAAPDANDSREVAAAVLERAAEESSDPALRRRASLALSTMHAAEHHVAGIDQSFLITR
jgi:hypothetical protein